ncbi:MAG: NAD(P)-binding protein [Desulfobacteraceae bacterium]|jgi:NADPH-dependent glutamate synthase beta subunit-like oxidoreductase
MNGMKHMGPDITKRYSYKELPIGNVGIGLPPVRRKTGLWRYMRPEYEAKIPPCQDTCPLGNWIQRFLWEVGQENLNEAWEALILENPFPGVCGRICHHPCEGACNRKEMDDALSIQAMERYLADEFFDVPHASPVLRERQAKKVAVVGAGPGGLACAYFLTLMGYPVTLFEARDELGGIPQTAIPSYRLPREVLEKEIRDILSLGIKVKTGCRIASDLAFDELKKEYDAMFLATGAAKEPLLNMAGEQSEGVMRCMDFLTRVHRKEDIRLGKSVVVIGGGNAAIDAASTALRMGAEHVTLVCLEARDEMPAWDYEIEDALEEGIRIVNRFGLNRFLHEGNRIRGVEFKRCTAVFDEKGAFAPRYDDRELSSMDADTVIVSIGRLFDSAFTAELGISATTKGAIAVHPLTHETSMKGVFAGGDAVDQPWTVSHAIGSAKRAAIAMDYYLHGDDPRELADQGALARTMLRHLGLDLISVSGERKVAALEDLNLNYVVHSARHAPDRLSPSERINSFREITSGLDGGEVCEEARRCLSCGVCRLCGNCYLFCPDGAVQLDPQSERFTINYDYCKGCGVCQNECPCGYISMISEREA